MSEPKKQHYVPQTYLRNFSFSDSTPQKIFVLHKDKSEIFRVNISDTAAERHFYTVKKSDDQYLWENTYANEIEPLMRNILSHIISQCENVLIQNNSFVLEPQMKSQLAICMVYQLLRGKHSREFQQKFYSKVLPSVINEARKNFAPIDEIDEKILKFAQEENDYFKLASMQVTFDSNRLQQYINILLKKTFVVYRIIGKAEFITSDNPVMFLDSLSLRAKPFSNGLALNTTVVFFPVSPKLVIAAYHPNFYAGAITELDGKLIFLDSCKEHVFIQTQNQKQFE